MGKTKRDVLKRKVAQSYHAIDNAMIPVAELEQIFRQHHPDLADGLIAVAELLNSAQQVLELFALNAWDMTKDKFEVYRR